MHERLQPFALWTGLWTVSKKHVVNIWEVHSPASAAFSISYAFASAACCFDSLIMVALTTSEALSRSISVWALLISTSFLNSSSLVSVARVASIWATLTSLSKAAFLVANKASASDFSVSRSVRATAVSASIFATSRAWCPRFSASPTVPFHCAFALY